MEEKKITEQESLELIARMIELTKENLEVGRGNQFLYFGYFAFVLSIVVFACVKLTQNNHFSGLWWLMFLCWGHCVVEVNKANGGYLYRPCPQ